MKRLLCLLLIAMTLFLTACGYILVEDSVREERTYTRGKLWQSEFF